MQDVCELLGRKTEDKAYKVKPLYLALASLAN